MEIVAHAYNDYTDKFGIPRQAGRVRAVETRIVFTAPFRTPDAIRGIEQWSHLWLIWQGEDTAPINPPHKGEDSPLRNSPPAGGVRGGLTVRPPRLGGNTRLGVFATRSPFRPNGLCLSSVELVRVEQAENEGHILVVAGADLMNGTPIYDIKPYLPYTDAHPDASNGFAEDHRNDALTVRWTPEAEKMLSHLCHDDNYLVIHHQLTQILQEDPRPAYHNDPNRIYGLTFGNFNLHFRVEKHILTVLDIAFRE